MSPDRILRLGDNITTDDIIPAFRCSDADPSRLARYAFEHMLEGNWLSEYDAIEAGENFGCGSAREHAPLAIQASGIRVVRARSFGEMFFRNAVNIGLPVELIDREPLAPLIREIIAAGGLFAWRRAGGRADEAPVRPSRPMTLVEKILARASGRTVVAPGDALEIAVDLALLHDGVTGPIDRIFTRQFGLDATLWDRQRVVLVADHLIQTSDIRGDPRASALYKVMGRFAERHDCRFLDQVSPGDAQGICHVLLPEAGLIAPAAVIAGTDSHTCTYGAFGALGLGVGSSDMAQILATGRTWMIVPPTIRVELNGHLPNAVHAKDIVLKLLSVLGADGALGRVLEFVGPVLGQLSMDERMTLTNMAVESGAISGLIAPDDSTRRFVDDRGVRPLDWMQADADAAYDHVCQLDLSDLEPQVAEPSSPDNVVPARLVKGRPITTAFIGSCTGGKLDDLAAAAMAIAGQRVAPGVRFYVVPATQAVRRAARRLGYLDILEACGARILKTGCGACINAGIGSLEADDVAIFATSRNFTGRSGHPAARVYLASPRTVAKSAVRGAIDA